MVWNPGGDITNLHYNFVVAEPLLLYKLVASPLHMYSGFLKITSNRVSHCDVDGHLPH